MNNHRAVPPRDGGEREEEGRLLLHLDGGERRVNQCGRLSAPLDEDDAGLRPPRVRGVWNLQLAEVAAR